MTAMRASQTDPMLVSRTLEGRVGAVAKSQDPTTRNGEINDGLTTESRL